MLSGSDIYQGADYVDGVKQKNVGLASKVVSKLLESDFEKGHIVILDNFYTSLALAQELLRKKTYLVGQIKSNASGLPKLWVSNCKVELKVKGSYDWVMIPNVALLGWKDTKLNFMLSTVPSLANKRLKKPFETTVIRREGGTEKDRRSHTPAKLYNEEMGV